jgi:hypothetical protein
VFYKLIDDLAQAIMALGAAPVGLRDGPLLRIPAPLNLTGPAADSPAGIAGCLCSASE